MFGLGRSRRSGGDGRNTLEDGREVRLALYKYDACPYCARVFRALDALDVAVEYRDVVMQPGWREDLRARTGRTQVPMLLIDEEPMFESADIAAWLTRHFPKRSAR